jgi:organic radical activating enzyme
MKKLIPYSFLIRFNKYYLLLSAKKRLRRRDGLYFGVHVVDHCNLNCKCCDNFSPISDESYLNPENFEKDCARISYLTGGDINGIGLRGGEPLLHPDITILMAIARKYFPNCTIEILTNGILLLKQSDKFWKSCKDNRIAIKLTKYPIKLDFENIEKRVTQNGVKFEYFNDTKTVIKKMHCIPFDIDGKQDVKCSFTLCYKPNVCTDLSDGKIYPCDTIPYIKYFNKQFNCNLEVSENDYIDIYKVKSIDEIMEFLTKPVKFCRYCNLKNPRYNIEWGISKKEISEWV